MEKTLAAKLGEFCGRLLTVLVQKKIISSMDALFIDGKISENEWLGNDDE